MNSAFMKIVFAAIGAAILSAGCASGPKVTVKELENKGTAIGGKTPAWVTNYAEKGVSAVQALPEYKDRYCIIGEETGVNKQFVLAWADNFSAQQRIGAMLRTSIASRYDAAVKGSAQSQGGGSSASGQGTGSGSYQQEIDNSINTIVNVNYSGAQLEANWWVLQRRYDPDLKDVWSDEYTSYVLYTIPKAILNQQIADALLTNKSKDPVLADITARIAEDILRNGIGALDPAVEKQ